jgi:hypothetical protein
MIPEESWCSDMETEVTKCMTTSDHQILDAIVELGIQSSKANRIEASWFLGLNSDRVDQSMKRI